MLNTSQCLICGASAQLAFKGHWGFQAPGCFDLYECEECETSFAQPMHMESEIYDLIYRNSERIPGYERYSRYRDLLTTSDNPLGDLCAQEDVYWAVHQAIREMEREDRGRPLKILEVGSGFGYLTYALRRAGYDCTGIDISGEAIKMAVRDFGNFYCLTDLMELTTSPGETFDVIVATELVEHIPNPVEMLRKAASLLSSDGAVLITTPNRDIYPRKLVWHTDPPPVHLWWFSKTSFRFLAWKLGMSLKFVDFSPFYGYRRALARTPSKPQTFDEKGGICFKDSALRTFARRAVAKVPTLFRPLARLLLVSLALRTLKERLFHDSLSLCVVLRRCNQ